ncbi:hypothetical protein L1277_001447 [Okibacterium sp. HSC-33S16]|uniref:hypothetical protein n=1 Tax=Okibacterium sp. HSC-33S16 TaxID=2910965 RepID=UPI0020A1B0A3|nr:hypothetical protein [Okibacterium sp. HSC-33S16]MCP2031356.1 hypothetical protein [Okibacterium sp. HSC-33S16]
MSDERDIQDQLKITDADAEVSPADRTEAGANTGSESTEGNVGVLGDVAHPFDQTNGIVDGFDERLAQDGDPVTSAGGVDSSTDETTDAVGTDAGTSGRHAAPVTNGSVAPDDDDSLTADDTVR